MTKKASRSASSSGSRKTTRAKSGSSTPRAKSSSATKSKSSNGSTPKRSASAKDTKTKTAKSPARTTRSAQKLGRSRIPVDAPLDVVFEHDQEARAAFNYLGIGTIRELQKFGPDELIMRLTSPTKLTVGRIRKMLAANNRCLDGDERFALEAQKQKK